jgi:LysR family transcriptional regulator, transcriptional activator for dmlA
MNTHQTPAIDPADLHFMLTLAACPSLSATGRELGVSTAAVSKRLAAVEARLGLRLVTRNTRRMGLSPDGETFVQHARRIVADINALHSILKSTQAQPSGMLRVNATLGFGRNHIAPLVAAFVKQHPLVEVQLQLSVDPPALTDDAFDVCIHFGPPPDARVMARRLAANQRLLCASPAYLAQHGTPQHPQDLARHSVIGIRQGHDAYGLLRLQRVVAGKDAGAQPWHSVKTQGRLTTNDGGIAVQWALDGLGAVLRSQWDVAEHLASGKLVRLLPQYTAPNADIYAVYPPHLQTAPKLRAFVQFLETWFESGLKTE